MENTFKELCQYIIDNIYSEVTMEKLENEFNYSKYYLIRLFKLYTGFTIKEFINTVKVLKTINPLLFTNDTILKIALMGGFNSQEYYSEKFQEIIGISPIKFRKEYSNIDLLNDVNDLKNKKDYLMNLNIYYENLLNISKNIEKNNKVKKLINN